MSLFVYFLSTTVSYLSIAIYLSLQLYAIVNFLSAFLFWELLSPFLVFRGGLGFPLGSVRILRSSFPLFVRCSRCVYPPCGERFGGLMARNPASYVSCLTLVTRRMCESAFLFDIVASLFVRPSPVFVDLSTLQAWFLSATFL